MVVEYWLQKKTIGGWSNVTWYSDKVQAETNYMKLLANKGYSYRMVEVNTIQVDLLDEVVEVQAPIFPEPVSTNKWDMSPKPVSNGWADTANGWNSKVSVNVVKPSLDIPSDSSKPEHGLTGSVWLIHHGNKDKKRVANHLVSEYEANGYERGGPKTKFRE